MKKKILIVGGISIGVITVVVSLLIYILGILQVKPYIQALDYTEDINVYLNPDQGFYRTACVSVTPTGVEDKSYIIKDDFQLYHLRMDISEFSGVVNKDKDFLLSDIALTKIQELIGKFFDNGKNVILRFSYDKNFNGLENQEPQEEFIYKHIEQICQIANKFPYTITAIEAGMVGPWGEMHTSDIANKNVICNIIDKFLKNTTSIPILVRTPQMIYDYLGIGINQINSYTIQKNELAYRLGVFNDGFLGSDTDLGTYQNRELEIEWISKQTSHLPFGGEVVRPKSNLHNIDNCLLEMEKINLSYLNYEWNDEIVQQKWQEQKYTQDCGNNQLYYNKSAYQYIRNHIGYRFVLNESIFLYNGKMDDLKINLKIENVGFGQLNRTKNISVLFVKDEQVELSVTCGDYNGEDSVSLNMDISQLCGTYNVYLVMDNVQNNTKCYSIRFANNLWNNDLQANKIGKLNIK